MSNILVVLAARIAVRYDEPDWCSCRASFEEAREKLHFIALLSGCGQGGLTGLTAVELMLYFIEINSHACGHPVDNAADCRAMAFAEVGETEECAEGIHIGYRLVSG